jgi:hypothetical protein
VGRVSTVLRPVWHDGGMLGAAIIVFVLVIAIQVAVLMSGSIGAMLIGVFLRNEADATHEGSELIDLNG